MSIIKNIEVISAILLVLIATGCTNSSNAPETIQSQVETKEEEDWLSDDSLSQVSESDSSNQIVISEDEVSHYYDAAYFAKRGDDFYPLSWRAFNADGSCTLSNGSDGVIFRDQYYQYDADGPIEDMNFTVYASTGDVLVTRNGLDEVVFRQVIDSGYTLTWNDGGRFNYDEINGVDISDSSSMNERKRNALDVLSGQYQIFGGYVASPSHDSINAGYYLGTTFYEETLYFDVPFCTCSDVSYTAPVQKTKNGYFIVDISGVPSGKYLATVANADPTLIIIN